ncbi:MAG TPA: hypothetical protein VEW26_12555 [Allosphingosinicella sp.]|nr:hypothetical protein [Allosphingosinicella sp.]
MRLLSDHEINLVSGGWGSSSSVYGGDITITGYMLADLSWYFDAVPYTDGGGGGGSSSPSTQDAEHQQTEDANDTPCVDQVPAGVDLSQLNDLAKYMGSVLAACQELSDWEWGAFIYKGSDGQLYQSEPFTAGHHDNINGATISLPPGAHIVAYLHTHPDDGPMDQRMLSDPDRSFISGLIGSSNSNWSADTNLLAYVVTNDNTTSYKTYVYDKSNRGKTSPGCSL